MIWTSVSAAPIPPPERGAVVVTTNVSAYVEASEALRHTNDELEARLTELLALNQLTQMVVAQVDLPAILATVAEQITLLLDATGTLVILLDNADRMLTFVADYDRDPAARSFVGTRIAFDAIPFAEHLIQTQRAMIISQPYINDLLRLFDAAPRTERYHAFMVVPLIMGGSTHGAIIVTGDQHARHFDDSAMRLAETVAGQVAGAIEQGKLLEAATRARSAAEAASQAKSHFLAAMSHELRTPLNVVLGYTQLLQRDETATLPQREALQIIRQSGEHLLMLIGDLIDLSKIEAGKIELTKGIVHLPALLEESAAMARLWAQHKGLSFVFERHPSDAAHACNALLDERRLRHVLLNLLGNAVKFTDQGRVTLDVACVPDPLDAGRIQVRFAVEDTGIGIDQADQSAIFTPFTQAGPPDRRAQGAGLGLAIATELLQAMGSTLQVRSAPGAGSCFWFELMLELADAPQPRAPAARHVLGASRRVLVVDATAASRTLLRDLLVPLGFVVLEAASAGDALAIAQQQPLDILVVDTAIADVPLAVLIPSLRRSMPPNGKVIAVSAHLSDAPDQSDARIANTRFLLKPLVLDALLEAIEEPEPTIELAAPQRAAAIVRPPLEERNAMLSLAQRGDIRALRRHASELAQRDSSYGPFVQTLDQLAATLQLDAYARTVAHDLKSPLSAIQGAAQLLQTSSAHALTAIPAPYLTIISSATRRATATIDALLLAQVRQMYVVPELLEMAPIIHNAIARLAGVVEQRHAIIKVPDRWPSACGYAPWVELAWSNYISNALKYGGDPPWVELGATRCQNDSTCFWEQDNGPGIGKVDQARLFGEFTRLEPERAEGYGLGLAIVRRITTRLGGEVGIESMHGQGSPFYFTLPAAAAAPP